MDKGIDFVIRKLLLEEYDIVLNTDSSLSEDGKATKYAKDIILEVQSSLNDFEDFWYGIAGKCDHPDNPIRDMMGEDIIPFLKSIYGNQVEDIVSDM